MRIAGWLIWTAYLMLGIAIAVFSFIMQSKHLDIGENMAAILLLGSAGALTTLALVAGSAIGSRAIVTDRAARRIGSVFTVFAGWFGTVLIGWLSWSFWTH
jgi:hypothetical protein